MNDTSSNNYSKREILARDLLKEMFPDTYSYRWNVEVTPDGIQYCDGDHDKFSECSLDIIPILAKIPERFKHKKRGSTYLKQAVGILQMEPDVVLKDGDELVVYIGENDGGKYWLRTPDEFHDGRFEYIKNPPSESKPDTFLNRLLKEERKSALINIDSASRNGSFQGTMDSGIVLRLLDKIEGAITLDGGVSIFNKSSDPKEIRNLKIDAMWNAHRHFISPYTVYEGSVPKERKDLKHLYETLLSAADTIDNFHKFDKTSVVKNYPDETFNRMIAQVEYVLKRHGNLDLGESKITLIENCIVGILRIASDFSEKPIDLGYEKIDADFSKEDLHNYLSNLSSSELRILFKEAMALWKDAVEKDTDYPCKYHGVGACFYNYGGNCNGNCSYRDEYLIKAMKIRNSNK